MHTHIHKTIAGTVLLVSLCSPFAVIATDEVDVASLMKAGEPFTQDMVLTGYYSPLPNQCCYVKGSYEADKVLNGEGIHGADGTPVYPGMVAAPPSYPFGTRVVLPGIGTFTVHDRGGAIQEWTDAHRIDVWLGSGEEGLARALAFGVRRVKATVYPPSSAKPAESVSLALLPAPDASLLPYLSKDLLLADLHPVAGQTGPSVRMLQQKLQTMGYLQDNATGFFGGKTQEALQSFLAYFDLQESAASLSERAGAYVEAAAARAKAKDPVAQIIDRTSKPADIAQAKRTLQFLGYFKGRVNGTFDHALFEGILSFQRAHQLASDSSSPGAGRIGPKTRALVIRDWQRKIVAARAEQILALRRLTQMVAKLTPSSTIGKGAKGDAVRQLQALLVSKGLLLASQITGQFGENTQKALVSYQLQAGIIAKKTDKGAGYAGPATLSQLRDERRSELYSLVRSQGWQAL